jgi:hypothetical protein
MHSPLCPDSLQASHCPSQAESQQTPSTHAPLSHCASPAHGALTASFVTQIPAEQYCVEEQSALVAQSPLQRGCAGWQKYEPQACCCSGPHEPSD